MFVSNHSVGQFPRKIFPVANIKFEARTELHEAAENKNMPELLHLLSTLKLALGKDAFQKTLDEQDEFGETALHASARQGDYAITEKLLKAGARTDIKSSLGQAQMPVDVAADYENHEVEKLIESYSPGGFNFETQQRWN